jgi:outer membrane protein
MNTWQTFVLIGLVLVLECDTLPAETSRWVVGAGLVHVQPETDDLVLQIPGSGAEFSSVTQALFAVGYRLSEHLGLEMLFAPPLNLSMTAAGSIEGWGPLVSVRAVTPVALLQYEFRASAKVVRPYLAAGLSYSVFYDEKTTDSFHGLAGTHLAIDYQNSFSPIFAAGLKYMLNDRWSIRGSVSYLEPNPDVRLTIADTNIESNGELSALAFTATLNYGF